MNDDKRVIAATALARMSPRCERLPDPGRSFDDASIATAANVLVKSVHHTTITLALEKKCTLHGKIPRSQFTRHLAKIENRNVHKTLQVIHIDLKMQFCRVPSF